MRFFFLIVFVLFSHVAIADEKLTSFNLERVIDGDTFVASGKKIRLWGIDAPEKDHPVSFASTLFLETLLKQGELECKQIDIDRYKRLVMQCFVDGKDVAADLVRFGLATDYKRYSKGHYNFEEDLARRNESGIWSSRIGDPL